MSGSVVLLGVVIGLSFASSACRELVSSPKLGTDQQDPTIYDNPAGAVEQARGALTAFRLAYDGRFSMTDETLRSGDGTDGTSDAVRADVRDFALTVDASALHRARLSANLAQAALAKFAAKTPASLRAEVLAVQGYTELVLADQFCSGVPLSTVDFEGNFTFDAGHSTLELYRHAASLFAAAAPLATAHDSIETFVRVGWGRALLGQGLFDSAAHVVAAVPTAGVYRIHRDSPFPATPYSLGDREGANGLPYVSSYDPRIVVQPVTIFQYSNYGVLIATRSGSVLVSDAASDSIVVSVASGVEARLIEAEAALQTALATGAPSDVAAWLTPLNTLRTTGSWTDTVSVFRQDSVDANPDGTPIYASTFIRLDTLWTPGTGGVGRLGPLSDPGAGLTGAAATKARVDLMFYERAFWLFLSGQRQGDMRRLIRQYGRTADQVYPKGIRYFGGVYGTAVNVMIREDGNPLFGGCLDRKA